MKIWHDDIRKPPEGWTWARTNTQAIALFLSHEIEAISLDHDLGLQDEDPDAPAAELGRGTSLHTGYDLVEWMIATHHLPESITIHSWNPDGAKRMAAALQDAGCHPVVKPYQMPDPYRALWSRC